MNLLPQASGGWEIKNNMIVDLVPDEDSSWFTHLLLLMLCSLSWNIAEVASCLSDLRTSDVHLPCPSNVFSSSSPTHSMLAPLLNHVINFFL